MTTQFTSTGNAELDRLYEMLGSQPTPEEVAANLASPDFVLDAGSGTKYLGSHVERRPVRRSGGYGSTTTL